MNDAVRREHGGDAGVGATGALSAAGRPTPLASPIRVPSVHTADLVTIPAASPARAAWAISSTPASGHSR